MLGYKKICENCIDSANDVCRAWEHLYGRALNDGEPITSPYDVITLDDIDGGFKEINEICKEIETDDMLDCHYMYTATNKLIHAFCEIIGEPYNDNYISKSLQHFWEIAPISCRYAFNMLEIWWVVSEYDKWLEKCESRENVGLVVKSWYNSIYRDKINLLHWLMLIEGVLDTTK